MPSSTQASSLVAGACASPPNDSPGSTTQRHSSAAQGASVAELWCWVVLPGESFGGDPHAPATRELAWVEEGTLTLTVAGARHQLGPGQCARFPGGLPHSYANEGTEPVRLTMVVVVPPAPS